MSKTKLSKELIVPTFNYDGIDPELKSKLICTAAEIMRSKAFHVKTALKIGEGICLANTLLAEHGIHGRFSEWVERECSISRSTAYNYMWAWERFGKCEAIDQINDGAMYLLSAPKVPVAASDEAAALAKKGIKITLDAAKKIVASYCPKVKASDQSSNDIGHQNLPIAENSEPSKPLEGEIVGADPVDDEAVEFDPAALDKETVRRNGKPAIGRKERKAAQACLGGLIRALDQIGIYDQHEPALSAIARHLENV